MHVAAMALLEYRSAKRCLQRALENLKGREAKFLVGKMAQPQSCTVKNVVHNYQKELRMIVETTDGTIYTIKPENFVL